MIPAGAPILTADAMRAAEARAFAAGASQDALMARAGIAVARAVRRLTAPGPVVVLAGPGNNGGDGYVAARQLAAWGHDVTVATLGAPKQGPAASAAHAWTGQSVPFAAIAPPTAPYVLVDALFGIGAQRPLALDAPQRALFERARFRIAADLPSGIDADSGANDWAPVPMTMTVALGALKPAHLLAAHWCGAVVLDDLGLQIDSGWRTIAQQVIAPPAPDDHKYRSQVTILAGAMPGAARLAARGAIGVGAGYVVLIGDSVGQGPVDAVIHCPASARADALANADPRACVVLGPGLGRDEAAQTLLDEALAAPCRLVLDGDAQSLLGNDAAQRLRIRAAPTILTPHAAEFARMFGPPADNKIADTVAAARAAKVTIVHKGAATVIADSSGAAIVSTGGSSWLASAGTGDLLAGAVAACAAPEAAVWLHMRASQLAGSAFSADRLADFLPLAVAECRSTRH